MDLFLLNSGGKCDLDRYKSRMQPTPPVLQVMYLYVTIVSAGRESHWCIGTVGIKRFQCKSKLAYLVMIFALNYYFYCGMYIPLCDHFWVMWQI